MHPRMGMQTSLYGDARILRLMIPETLTTCIPFVDDVLCFVCYGEWKQWKLILTAVQCSVETWQMLQCKINAPVPLFSCLESSNGSEFPLSTLLLVQYGLLRHLSAIVMASQPNSFCGLFLSPCTNQFVATSAEARNTFMNAFSHRNTCFRCCMYWNSAAR